MAAIAYEQLKMVQLPLEIVILIAEKMDTSTLCQFRLCCRLFAEIGLQQLSIEIVAYYHSESRQQLEDMMAFPAFCQRITRLHFDLDALEEPGLTYEMYEQELERHEHIEATYPDMFPKRSLITRDNLRYAYRQYMDEIEAQQDIFDDNEHHILWRKFLKQCRQLECLTIASGREFQPKYRDKWRSPYRKYYYGASDDTEGPSSAQELESLLRMTYEAGLKLKKLQVGHLDWTFFVDANPVRIDALLMCLDQVTSLKIIVDTGADEDLEDVGFWASRSSGALSKGGLRLMVAGLPQLQTLTFRCNYKSDDLGFGGAFEHIFDSEHTWPRLRKLELGRIRVDRNSNFVDFVKKHHKSLRSLELDTICLQESWTPFLQETQRHTSLEYALVYGELQGDVADGQGIPREEWNVLHPSDDGDDSLRDAISHFLVHGGTCPLTRDGLY